jgi:hypothetical protein
MPRFGQDVPPHARRPVAWYAPATLWQAARKLLAAEQFATHLDRRETFPSDLRPVDLSADPCSPAAPFWFDFASDTGDGGDATVAVAQGLLAPSMAGTQALDERGQPLPQGRLLVLGGDLAYPGSGRLDYQYRFIEPLDQALRWAQRRAGFGRWRHAVDAAREGTPIAADDKVVVAIPQNHDWAVSASTFCRYFVNTDAGAVLGARTPQRQTWFALKLPRNWWVLGLDFALEGDLDRPQYEGFKALLNQGLGAGSQVVLVYPEPYWTRPLGDHAPEGYPKRYQRLEARFLAAGARIRLRLAGDLHHVAHEQLTLPDGSDTHLLVAGHGGAFTHATHTQEVRGRKVLRAVSGPGDELAQHVEIGLPRNRDDAALPAFEPGVRYPDEVASRRLGWRAWAAAFRARGSGMAQGWRGWWAEQWDSNRGLLPVLGGLVGLLTWFGWGIHPQVDLSRVPSPSAVLPALAVLVACAAAVWDPLAPRRALLLGAGHGLAQLGAAWGWTLLCFNTLGPWLGWPAFVLASALSGGLLLGLALALACGGLGLASNAASGLVAHEGHKGFVRFRLDDAGLTAFVLGLDEVPAQTAVPTDAPLPSGWRVVARFTLRD